MEYPLKGEQDQSLSQYPLKKDQDQNLSQYPLRKEQDPSLSQILTNTNDHPEGGKINDDLRFLIIEQVAVRPAIWDHGREPKCLGQRKDHFIEIAALLSTENNILSCYDVEKQWKNLKDTYIKTKKKLVTDESGCIVPPRWKFFSAMMFLDQLGSDAGAPTAPNSASLLGKRNSRSFLARDRPVLDMPTESKDKNLRISANSKQPSECSKSFDDEYTAFCKALVFPLREIGSINRVELLKLQKEIHDVIHAKRLALLQATNH